MEDLIAKATYDVEANGYLNADPVSVQLAVSGYMIREFRAAISEGREKKSGVPKVIEKAKMPGMLAGIVAVVEGVRAFFGN